MKNGVVTRVHWSFWLIGVVALIFNLMGCVNFVSQMNAEMIAGMAESYRMIVESRPAWGTLAFAIAVFGGVLGALMLLLRRSAAYPVLIASLIGAVAAQIPFVGMKGFPIEAWVGGLMQLLMSAFLVWYAKWSERKGYVPRVDRRFSR